MIEKFGIFIRSIGERTENLTYESCLQGVDEKNIHIIKDFCPAWKAYEKMFNVANTIGYDIFLGIDADIVLKENWLSIVDKKFKSINNEDFFVITFHMNDPFIGNVDRGNHFYNGKYSGDALHILKTVTWKTLKPESFIRYYIDAKTFVFDDIIGYHGFEQYYRDIFYRFWLQYKRNHSELIKKQLFGEKKIISDDLRVARAGWNKSKKEFIKNILTNKLKILNINPNNKDKIFFEKYLQKLECNEKVHFSKSLLQFYEERSKSEKNIV